MIDPELTDLKQETHDRILSGIKENGCLRVFPSGSSEFSPHSGIPPIMGLFEERSPSSMNGAAFVHDGVSIIDEFVDFYEQYSYASGVIDPNADLAATGHVRRVAGSSLD